MDLEALPVEWVRLGLRSRLCPSLLEHLLQRLHHLLLGNDGHRSSFLGACALSFCGISFRSVWNIINTIRLCWDSRLQVLYGLLQAPHVGGRQPGKRHLLHQLVIDVALRRVEVGATSAVMLPLLVVAHGTHAVVLVVCVFSWPRDVFHRYLINAGQLVGFIEF